MIADEVLKAAAQTGASVREAPANSREVIDHLASRFARLTDDRPLWESLVDSFGIRDADAWRLPALFLAGKRCLLAFDPEREDRALVIDDGRHLTDILSLCSGFEFYVTDASYDFLLCFNHHDFLIAAGTARSWLARWGHATGARTTSE